MVVPTGTAAEAIRLQRQDLLREQAFVGGVWTSASEVNAKPIVVRNPATGETIGCVPNLGAAQTERAVSAAHLAFRDWRLRTARERADVLRRWHSLVIRHADDLARLMTAEQGKPLSEALREVYYAASFLEWFSEEARRVYGDVIPGHQVDKRILVRKEPVGALERDDPSSNHHRALSFPDHAQD